MSRLAVGIASDVGLQAPAVVAAFGHGGWASTILHRVGFFLALPLPDRLHIDVSSGPRGLAGYGLDDQGLPRIALSIDMLRPEVLAHEAAHALVPSCWLMIAEGLATAAAIGVVGDCRPLLFEERCAAEVVAKYWHGKPTLDTLALERQGQAEWLAPEGFAQSDGRIALALAAAFLEFGLEKAPGLAGLLVQEDRSPHRLVRDALGLGWSEATGAFLRTLQGVGPDLPIPSKRTFSD